MVKLVEFKPHGSETVDTAISTFACKLLPHGSQRIYYACDFFSSLNVFSLDIPKKLINIPFLNYTFHVLDWWDILHRWCGHHSGRNGFERYDSRRGQSAPWPQWWWPVRPGDRWIHTSQSTSVSFGDGRTDGVSVRRKIQPVQRS